MKKKRASYHRIHGHRTRRDAVHGALRRLQRILQDHIRMEQGLQQDHLNPNPPSLLHLSHPHRSLQHPLRKNPPQHPTNDGNPTRHAPIPQPHQHALFRMGHFHSLQAPLLHLPPHLLPLIHLSSGLHRGLNLHFTRSHFLQSHERCSQSMEKTHGNFFMHLCGVFRVQRYDTRCFRYMGTCNRTKEWWGCGFGCVGDVVFRGVCVLNGGLATGECGDRVGGRHVRGKSNDEDQRVDKRENRVDRTHILEARDFFWVDTVSVQENGGTRVEVGVCG